MTDPDNYDYPYDDYPYENDSPEGDEEWRPGQCDNCSGGDENGVTATGPLGPVFCACFIGQGASEDECQCGPLEDVEEQPPGANATAPELLAATAQLSLLLPYAFRVDRPAPHRPEGEFMMSYGTWDTAPGPITTVEHAATYEAARVRVQHAYYGPMTVRVWPHRGDGEHYRNDAPPGAYVLQLGDQTDTINPNTKAAVDQLHNSSYTLCVPCHSRNEETPDTSSAGGSSG